MGKFIEQVSEPMMTTQVASQITQSVKGADHIYTDCTHLLGVVSGHRSSGGHKSLQSSR